MQKLVSPFQASFVKGRNITDNVVIAQEIIHSMEQKKTTAGYLVMKVDLMKTYDRLSWHFILDTLIDSGFPHFFVNLIMKCITFASMQVSWNG